MAVALTFGAGAALGAAVGPIDSPPAPVHAPSEGGDRAPPATSAPAHREEHR